jgi:hypothetical protein
MQMRAYSKEQRGTSTRAFGLTQKFGSGFSVYFYFGLLLLGTEVLP